MALCFESCSNNIWEDETLPVFSCCEMILYWLLTGSCHKLFVLRLIFPKLWISVSACNKTWSYFLCKVLKTKWNMLWLYLIKAEDPLYFCSRCNVSSDCFCSKYVSNYIYLLLCDRKMSVLSNIPISEWVINH